jgi:hypothetical protein
MIAILEEKANRVPDEELHAIHAISGERRHSRQDSHNNGK